MAVMPVWKFVDKDLQKALGLPEYTTSFVLRADVDDVVRIECAYIVPAEGVEAIKRRLKQFELVEKGDVVVQE